MEEFKMPKEVKELEQDESEKQKLYLNMNLKKIGDQLEKMNTHLEHINRNLGLIADPEFRRKYEEYNKNRI